MPISGTESGVPRRLLGRLLVWSGLAMALGLSGAETAFPEGAPAVAEKNVQDTLLASVVVSEYGTAPQQLGLWQRKFGRFSVGVGRDWLPKPIPQGPEGKAIPDLCFFVAPLGSGGELTGSVLWAHYVKDPDGNTKSQSTVSYRGSLCIESSDGDLWIALARSDYPKVRLLGFRLGAAQRKARAESAVGGVPTFEEASVKASDWMAGTSPDAVAERTLDDRHGYGVAAVGLVAMQDGVLAHFGFGVKAKEPLLYLLAEGKSNWEEVGLRPVVR